MRAVAYIRVSSHEQVEGHSLGAQERLFNELCKSRSWELAGVYREEGKSAHMDSIGKRPVFQQLLEDAGHNRFDVVVVHTLMGKNEMALLANEIERKDLGFSGGSQDSFGAAIGGAKIITYPTDGPCHCERIQVAESTLYQLEENSLLIYTGGVHLSGTIHADIKKSYAQENSPTIKALAGVFTISAANCSYSIDFMAAASVAWLAA